MVKVYRLSAMIPVDVLDAEKIFQRQITKLGLSSSTFFFYPCEMKLISLGRSIDWQCKNSRNTLLSPIPF